MATRIGVIAIRGDAHDVLTRAFPALARCAPRIDAGWVYASASLWRHGALFGHAADQALAALRRPGLQLWTEDDARWYLVLHRPKRPPLRYVQVLRYLDPPRGKKTLAAFLAEQEEDLPDGCQRLGPAPRGPVSGLRAHCRARAGLVCDALAEAKVPHDRAAVIGALAGDDVTRVERGWGTGNLARFLDAIGLGAVFEGWREELAEERKPARRKPAPPPDLAKKVLDHLGDAPLATLSRPVAARPAALWLLPWACNPEVDVAFVVAPSRPVALRWPRAEGLVVVEDGGVTRLGLAWQSVWLRAKIVAALEPVLARLPAGSTVELAAAALPDAGDDDDDDEPVLTSGDMRFRGTVSRGVWRLTHASPKAPADTLAAALALFTRSLGRAPFEAASAAEASAIVALAARGGQFSDDVPVAAGRTIRVADGLRPYLAMVAFRHRFARGPWDARSAQAADEADAAEWADLANELTGLFAAPRDEALVHQGKRSAFRAADISKVKAARGKVAAIDAAMAAGGLRPLGDMVCEVFGDLVIRGYRSDAGDAYGMLYAGTTGQLVYELYTAFRDGSTLTTSINQGAGKGKARFVHLPDASVETVVARHAAAVTRSRARPQQHAPELAGLAREIDAYLVRSRA
jgi:hypothetical protein